jgi:hypothetical protein
MKTLPPITATAEQLPLISQNRLGVEVICGAAGSGKTSTAILRLRSLSLMFAARHARQGNEKAVKVLVLAFNRTLAGYIRALVAQQFPSGLNVDVTVDTFARWSQHTLGTPKIANGEAEIKRLAKAIPLAVGYVAKEVDYILGRFEPEKLESYITAERTGRGNQPRVDRGLRRRILDEVVYPYRKWLEQRRELDWNGLAVAMSRTQNGGCYEVVIVDESQDFSANQLRAIRHHLADDHSITFVIDTVQRIYARGFTWTEVGFDVRPERYHVLNVNHRNTAEIAAFASGILQGIGVEGDGALPNLAAAAGHGAEPIVLHGTYKQQVDWAIAWIKTNVNLAEESVGFLKPQGGGWFDYLKARLLTGGIRYATITREADWPTGSVNVALSTFHSAKGLEFDHVFIVGLNQENTKFEDADRDDQIFVLRRLLAVAVARARETVVVGFKEGEESRLTDFFRAGTFKAVQL